MQTYNADVYSGTQVAGTSMQLVENNFAALKSSFSGTTSPSNTVAGQWYLNTINLSMKYRNVANNAWYGVMHGDSSQKIWVYRNSAMDGWVVDSSVSDKVLVAKGGTTYTAGGATAGTWQTVGHALTEAELASHGHSVNSGGPTSITIPSHTASDDSTNPVSTRPIKYEKTKYSNLEVSWTYSVSAASHTHTATNTGGGASHDHGATWRPAAAVNTLQYLSLA